ncbi:hypothetical protein [Streptomyces sp. SID13031]|uniref:hypothetical protein n=1 Tax=Streptomyces sp. SID13031 TaxID=2706046 RepID=UPI0013C781CD|nr:hypothetical protein [Streptomyces sp. SID13031]NEA34775.1 hypothetical protein [Streptomyces sp. SID13031]
MRTVVDRVSPEMRLKTGWLIPAVIGFVLSQFFSDSVQDPLSQSDRIAMSVLSLAGVLGGVLWQWYSPRDLAERLAFPATVGVAVTVILILPIGEPSGGAANYSYLYPVGLIAGLVLATRWKQIHTED